MPPLELKTYYEDCKEYEEKIKVIRGLGTLIRGEGIGEVFDSDRARDIRVTRGYSQDKLAEKLGIHQADVSRSERGGIGVHPSKSRVKYLEWLKEQGYDPYRL